VRYRDAIARLSPFWDCPVPGTTLRLLVPGAQQLRRISSRERDRWKRALRWGESARWGGQRTLRRYRDLRIDPARCCICETLLAKGQATYERGGRSKTQVGRVVPAPAQAGQLVGGRVRSSLRHRGR